MTSCIAASSASDIVDACVAAGSISAASGKMILAEIENTQARDIITTDPDATRDRSLSWTFQPMADGGAVVLVEDITERQSRSQDQPSGALRCADRRCPTASFSATRSSACWRSARAPSGCRRCSSSISTSSSRSTTRSAIPAATSCCAPSPTGCARCCGRTISSRASAATNSSCSSRTSSRPRGGRGPRPAHRRRLSEPYEIGNHLVEIGASIGIAHDLARQSAPIAAEERRHGALSRQGRRPRHLPLLPRRDGANARPAAPSNSTCAGAGQRGIRAVLPAAVQSQVRARSRPARRCCAGRIRCAAWSRRPSSFRSPRTWA